MAGAHRVTKPRQVPTAEQQQLGRLGAVESFTPVVNTIQWVGTNYEQIVAWWVGIELPPPRMYPRGDVEYLGIWCNPQGGKDGYRLIHTTDWVVFRLGRVEIITAPFYSQYKNGHRVLSGVSEG
jgi:hypothetical protein